VEFDADNISATDLFNLIEYAIKNNPDSNGVQLEDLTGRTWYIQLENVTTEVSIN
jgi:hypothetical protein